MKTAPFANTNTISPADLRTRIEGGEKVEMLDVRTPGEYAAVHVTEARLIPLDCLNPHRAIAERHLGAKEPLYVLCQTGGRAAEAVRQFHSAGFPQAVLVTGGTDGCVQAGLPVVHGERKTISLERQVRIAAGFLVTMGITLGGFLHPAFFGISLFVGLGLIFAGITDWCGMGMLLARMPWNR